MVNKKFSLCADSIQHKRCSSSVKLPKLALAPKCVELLMAQSPSAVAQPTDLSGYFHYYARILHAVKSKTPTKTIYLIETLATLRRNIVYFHARRRMEK